MYGCLDSSRVTKGSFKKLICTLMSLGDVLYFAVHWQPNPTHAHIRPAYGLSSVDYAAYGVICMFAGIMLQHGPLSLVDHSQTATHVPNPAHSISGTRLCEIPSM